MDSVFHNLNLLTFATKIILHVKKRVRLCREIHYMWWGNQELELQEWEDFIKYNKTRILAIIMLVPNNNPQGYKENVIFSLKFPLEKVLLSYIGDQT